MAVLIRRALAVMVVVACTGAIVRATPQTAEFLKAQQANRAALLAYTWKSRTELKVKGESKSILLEQVRYDIDGRVQKTPIGGSKEEARQGPALHPLGGVIRHKVVAKKTEQFNKLMQDLTMLAASYAHVPQERMREFAAHAVISEGEGADRGVGRLQGRNVNQPGDAMTIWIDATSSMMRRVEIATSLDANPVDLVIDYRSLNNGLTYQARSLLRYPDKQIELAVETYEYQFVGTSR